MASIASLRGQGSKHILILLVVLLIPMLLSACDGDPQAQQRATSQKSQLDGLIVHARNIGVPNAMLQPIVNQEQEISSTSKPFTIFDQPITDYYNNIAKRCQMLSVEVGSLETKVT